MSRGGNRLNPGLILEGALGRTPGRPPGTTRVLLLGCSPYAAPPGRPSPKTLEFKTP